MYVVKGMVFNSLKVLFVEKGDLNYIAIPSLPHLSCTLLCHHPLMLHGVGHLPLTKCYTLLTALPQMLLLYLCALFAYSVCISLPTWCIQEVLGISSGHLFTIFIFDSLKLMLLPYILLHVRFP
jgi:hypothetical protein